MMLLKWCTHYASTFGKLIRGHRTGKGRFSFQSQRKAIAMNAQITIKLYSFYMSARLCSNSFKLGFSSIWTENFWMYRLIWKRQRNQRYCCQHLLYHRKTKGVPGKLLLLLHWLNCFTDCFINETFDCVDHNKLWTILKEMGIPEYLTCLLRKL